MKKDLIQSVSFLGILIFVLVVLKYIDTNTGYFSDLAARFFTSIIN